MIEFDIYCTGDQHMDDNELFYLGEWSGETPREAVTELIACSRGYDDDISHKVRVAAQRYNCYVVADEDEAVHLRVVYPKKGGSYIKKVNPDFVLERERDAFHKITNFQFGIYHQDMGHPWVFYGRTSSDVDYLPLAASDRFDGVSMYTYGDDRDIPVKGLAFQDMSNEMSHTIYSLNEHYMHETLSTLDDDDEDVVWNPPEIPESLPHHEYRLCEKIYQAMNPCNNSIAAYKWLRKLIGSCYSNVGKLDQYEKTYDLDRFSNMKRYDIIEDLTEEIEGEDEEGEDRPFSKGGRLFGG